MAREVGELGVIEDGAGRHVLRALGVAEEFCCVWRREDVE